MNDRNGHGFLPRVNASDRMPRDRVADALEAVEEQQRIANLISLWALDNDLKGQLLDEAGINDDAPDPSPRIITEGLGLA